MVAREDAAAPEAVDSSPAEEPSLAAADEPAGKAAKGEFYRSLDRIIEAMPDGPAASLVTPTWVRFFDRIGLVGWLVGMLPSALILFLEPQAWMVIVARIGLAIVAAGWGVSTCYRAWLFIGSVRRWRVDQAHQLDHDFAEWQQLCGRLAEQPRQFLEQHLRWLQHGNTRLAAKLGFLAGGVEKLGILPLFVAVALQAKVAADMSEIPSWQLVLGLFAGLTYFIALVGTLMRLRMQLYECAIAEALRVQEAH